jgi:type IV pilus assembly protein PilO
MSVAEKLTKMPVAKKVFFLAFFVVLVGAGFWFNFYGPVLEELENLEKKHKTLVRDLSEAEKTKKTYEADRQKRDELSKSSSKQLQMLPTDAEMASFLNNLNSQAELVGLEIMAVKPLDEEPARYYARIPVQLKLRGSFHQISKFFYLVGNLDRIINIEDINLGGGEMDDSGIVLTTEVLATTFRSVQPRAAKKREK